MDAALEYDSSSIESILAYAKRLEGHTLREECPGLERVEDPHKRRGSFGNAVEKYYFHYEINSDPNADFAEVGTELKTTPLKQLKDGRLSAKERLVISMINYMSVVDETWETSSLQKKLHQILLIAYQYDKDLNPVDYLVRLVELWGFRMKISRRSKGIGMSSCERFVEAGLTSCPVRIPCIWRRRPKRRMPRSERSSRTLMFPLSRGLGQ